MHESHELNIRSSSPTKSNNPYISPFLPFLIFLSIPQFLLSFFVRRKSSMSKFDVRNRRPYLLRNWATSFLTIAQKTYHHIEHANNPISSLVHTLASISIPLLKPIEHQCLNILSYIDENLLFVEDKAMTIFPSTSYLFAIVDELALMAESLPKHFDEFIDIVNVLLEDINNENDAMVDKMCEDKKVVNVSMHCKGNKEEEEGNGDKVIVIEEFGARKEKKKKRKMEEEIKEVEDTYKDIIEGLEKMGTGNGKGKVHVDQKEKENVEEVVKDVILDLFDEGWGTKLL